VSAALDSARCEHPVASVLYNLPFAVQPFASAFGSVDRRRRAMTKTVVLPGLDRRKVTEITQFTPRRSAAARI